MSAQFTPEQEKAIREAKAAGGQPQCPICNAIMTTRSIGGGSFGLGYARKREWLICPSCRRSVIFDVKRGTRL
ncbi:MAG: hypothetical protein ACT4OZ_03750 [Gemmatimonadota bacterium]